MSRIQMIFITPLEQVSNVTHNGWLSGILIRIIRGWTLIAASLLWLLIPIAHSAAEENPTVTVSRIIIQTVPEFRIKAFVTVTDESGMPLKGLGKGNFQIKVDGDRGLEVVEASPFVTTDRTLGYAILVDNRVNDLTSLTLIQGGLKIFSEIIGFRYHGLVISYTGEPRVLSGPTNNAVKLINEAAILPPVNDEPKLFDGILFAADQLAELRMSFKDEIDDRLSLILLTDGTDNESLFSLDAAINRVLEMGIEINVVNYNRSQNMVLDELKSLSPRSGGRYFPVYFPDDLVPSLKNIGEMFNYEYVVTGPLPRDLPLYNGHTLGITVTTDQGNSGAEVEFVVPPGVMTGSNHRTEYIVAGGIVFFLIISALIILRRK